MRTILTTYFNHGLDPQRGVLWPNNVETVMPLLESVRGTNTRFVCLYNKGVQTPESTNMTQWVEVEPKTENPLHSRWFAYRDYLAANPKINKLWIVDATDTERLKPAFADMLPDRLYVGDEYNNDLDIPYMHNQALPIRFEGYFEFLNQRRKARLLNAGVIGGFYPIVFEFVNAMCNEMQGNFRHGLPPGDMPLFNYVCYKHFDDRLSYGRHITTRFKMFEKDTGAIWRHK